MQMEQHEPEGNLNVSCLGNVTHLLDVTPSNSLTHPLSPPPIPLHCIQDLVAKQQTTCT